MPLKSKPNKEVKTVKPDNKKDVSKPRSKSSGLVLGGVRDILPKDQKYWHLITDRIEQLAKDYGFAKIDTSILEKKALFEKGLGKNSRALEQIFSFVDQAGENIALRPTATFSLVRAYNEQKMNTRPQPVKLYYQGPMLRYLPARANNYRQTYQFGFEALGSDQPVVDAQLILIAFNFYKDLDIPAMVQINSIGCPACRAEYRKVLVDHYRQKKNLLCQNCKDSFAKNPLDIFGCQEVKCQELKEDVPQIIDHLCESCKNHFIKVLEYLDELGLPYILNPYLIRESDYGTRTVFELWPEEADRVTQPLARGGRYDDLAEALGGEPAPACGFAVEIEQVISKIREKEIPIAEKETYEVFLAQLCEQDRRKALVLFVDLREKGIKVAEGFSQTGLKAQRERA
ncbi:MAG: histidine--tRNA ligase, partial [bacterium]